MPDATGLSTRYEVRLNGIKIGVVRKVELSGLLDPQRAVEVRMRILSRFMKNIPIDSVTDISTDTLVGYEFLEIEAGKSPVPIREDGVLQSEPIKQAVNRADLIKALQDDVTQFDQILTQITSPDMRFGKFLTGEAEYNELLTQIEGFDQAIHRFLIPQTQLGQAFYSLRAYNAVHDPLIRLDNALATIERGEGATGRLFASDDQYNQILREL